MPLGDEAAALVSGRLQTALLRESFALVEGGTATPGDVDIVVTTTIGRRLAGAGPFEIWEQIGWDLVQVIAGALLKEISNSAAVPASLKPTLLHQALDDRATPAPETGADPGLIRNVAVIGAGLMGHGIALEFAASGRAVRLHDLSAELLHDAMKRADVGLHALTRTGRLSASDVNASIDRIGTSTNLVDCVGAADLVVEAASENLALKKKIFEQLDLSAPAHAILASNTSTFLPSAYASSTNRPERVVGVHYYNPPHLLPGVEIIRGPETSDQTATTVVALYTSIGKKPAVIQKEIQGFIGNRLQVALLREAMSIVESGIATAPEVDALVRTTFGKDLPNAGPFERARSAGLKATVELFEANLPKLSNSRELPDLLCQRVESGELGVKTGKGFYDWTPESTETWRENMANSLLEMATRDL
jgi:3-hydroxybutyryl-CoA dehydrogenase